LEKKIVDISIELADFLSSKKAEDITVLEMSKTTIADIFILVTSNSFVHSKILEDYTQEFLETRGYRRLNRPNMFPENPWILVDFGEIVINIFVKEAREYYNIEKLWYDAKKVYEIKESKVDTKE